MKIGRRNHDVLELNYLSYCDNYRSRQRKCESYGSLGLLKLAMTDEN